MLRENHDNENPHIKSRENEAKDPPQSLRKQQARPQASRWKKLRKTKTQYSSFFLPYCWIFPPPQPGSGNWLSSFSSHSPLNLPPSASLLTSPKETIPTSANDLGCFPQLDLKSYSTQAWPPKVTFPIQPFLTCAPFCRQRILCKNRSTASKLGF